ncbi:MAG: hypothetical protein RLZZ450_633 [Pseudomonadota bacterium]
MTRLRAPFLLLSLVMYACGSEKEPGDDEDGGVVLPTGDGGPEDSGVVVDARTRDADAAQPTRDATVFVPPAECGDGKRATSEECDDGNSNDGDGCDASCHKEAGFNCPATEGACASVCGDKLLVLGEPCDDGNSESGDGCSATCAVESGWSCLMSGVACVPAGCGDGIVVGSEACDDRNVIPGDGCSATCTVETGWLCPTAGVLCVAERCGDGVRAGTEACDDGFPVSGDGCSATCDAVEANFSCPQLGGACTRTSVCGNGSLTSDEQCDDRNTVPGDGCTATCTLERGWQCAGVGRACTAAMCGDDIVAGSEQCEDGNTAANDGCFNCSVESGYACEPGVGGLSACHQAVCRDGKVEGNETCDDGAANTIAGDGCGPNCVIEPSCAVGQPCTSSCGDGIRLPSDTAEECDDGNLRDDDGCSSTCKIERGFKCHDVRGVLPATFPLTVVYRDFISLPLNGASKHPDFETFGGSGSTGMVMDSLLAGKPQYTGVCEFKNPQTPALPSTCQGGAQSTSKANFDQWYGNDLTGPSTAAPFVKYVDTVDMVKQSDGSYRNPTFGSQLFPLDNRGFLVPQIIPPATTTSLARENKSNGHNFGFSTEIHHWFEFNGGEVLTFSGDDDVWVFVGGKLALDLGGLHSQQSRTIRLNSNGTVDCYVGNAVKTTPDCATPTRTLGLTPNNVYEMTLFHAERHTNQSNFDLTLTGFIAAKSVCVSACGDGIITKGEACDDGSMCAGGLNAMQSCSPSMGCTGGTCTDSLCAGGADIGLWCLASSGCPDGTCNTRNDGSYGRCDITCQDFGPHCGDKIVQIDKGEACDMGSELNRGEYNGCTQDCKKGPACGDAKVDAAYSEQCDMGTVLNVGGYNGCTAMCKLGDRCGDGVLQASNGEACDDGQNRSAYGGCGPGCVLAPRCGDGVVDKAKGEQCDNGTLMNDGRYGGCSATCTKGPRCGDRTVDAAQGERCDDGNLNDYDGCSAQCQPDIVI